VSVAARFVEERRQSSSHRAVVARSVALQPHDHKEQPWRRPLRGAERRPRGAPWAAVFCRGGGTFVMVTTEFSPWAFCRASQGEPFRRHPFRLRRGVPILYSNAIDSAYSGAIFISVDTREALIAAAFKVLEEEGEARFSTRAVLAIAGVSAPTLYHHFGNADGLLSATLEEAFRQFLQSKRAAKKSADPVTALAEGWDDYVRFAAARPRLYAAMLSRMLQGGQIPAAERAFHVLIQQLRAIDAQGRLAMDVDAAADRMWASANAASLLHVTARVRQAPPPSLAVLLDLRESALKATLSPVGKKTGKKKAARKKGAQ